MRESETDNGSPPRDAINGIQDVHSAPFFVVGAQRSGTTMLRLMLNAHSRLCVPFESVFIPVFYQRLQEYGDLQSRSVLERLVAHIAADPWVQKGQLIPDTGKVLAKNPQSYADLVGVIMQAKAESAGKSRWGDKTPGYVVDMDILNALFPDARIIHLVRDGRDVALSLARLSWGSRNLVHNAADWRWKVMLGRKMGGMMGERYREIRYEDLVDDPETVLANLCSFIGEIFEPAMLDYTKRAEQELPENSLRWHRSSISRPDANKALLWHKRMPISDQIIFEQVAGDALDAMGYERVGHRPTVASRLRFLRYTLQGHA